MPIRINLKEIFSSESQEILVDKLNFNFNKLLELGIGDIGPLGKTGPIGSAGPVGLVGDEGVRGSTWFVGTGDPNTQTFTGLLNNDFFIDSDNSTIWNYSSSTDTWSVVIDLETVVNNYLTTSGITFVRGLGTSSPDDNRYIVFPKRGNTLTDITQDILGGDSENDIFFLCNFNEKVGIIPITNFPSDTSDLYNAIQKIYTDFTSGVFGRYHLELGSLYTDGGNAVLTELKHNLKVRYYRDDVSASPTYAATNQYINIARFSLSIPELDVLTNIDFNALYDFITPKYNAESSVYRNNFAVKIGSAEALGEYASYILADGISFTLGTEVGNIGIASNYQANNVTKLDNKTHIMLDANGDISILLNKETYQTGGSFTQVISTEQEIINSNTAYTGTVVGHHMSQGILLCGNNLWVVSGIGTSQSPTGVGSLSKYDISRPDLPDEIVSISGDQRISTSFATPQSDDQHGHPYTFGTPQHNIGLIKDIGEFGKYIITINHRSSGAPGTGFANDSNDLYIFETDSFLNNIYPIASLSAAETQDAYRIQIHGKYAWIITNKTYVTGPQGTLTGSQARLTAVDISNPLAPVVVDSYQETNNGTIPGVGTKYLDFDIKDTKAVVIRHTNVYDLITPPDPKHALELLVFDIENPAAFSDLQTTTNFPSYPTPVDYSPQAALSLETRTINTTSTEYAGLDVNGRYAYVVWEDRLFIVEIDNSVSLKSSALLPVGSIASDIIVRGDYAYILVSKGVSGAIQVYDVSNKTTPVLVTEYIDAQLAKASRLVISGKYIYVVATNGTTTVNLLTIDTTGTQLPAASIGELSVDSIQVKENAYIKNDLIVKNDTHIGGHLHAQDISANFSHVKGYLDVNIVPAPGTGWGLVVASTLFSGPAKLKMNAEVFDAYSEFSANGPSTSQWSNSGSNLSRSRFTAKHSGYYVVKGLMYYAPDDISSLPFTTFLAVLQAVVNGTASGAPALPSHGGFYGATGTRYTLATHGLPLTPTGTSIFGDNVGFMYGENTIYLNSGDYVELGLSYLGANGGDDDLYINYVEFHVNRIV